MSPVLDQLGQLDRLTATLLVVAEDNKWSPLPADRHGLRGEVWERKGVITTCQKSVASKACVTAKFQALYP